MHQNHTLHLGLLELFQNNAEPLGKFKFWKSLKQKTARGRLRQTLIENAKSPRLGVVRLLRFLGGQCCKHGFLAFCMIFYHVANRLTPADTNCNRAFCTLLFVQGV